MGFEGSSACFKNKWSFPFADEVNACDYPKAPLTCYADCKEEDLHFILLILPPNLSIIKLKTHDP